MWKIYSFAIATVLLSGCSGCAKKGAPVGAAAAGDNADASASVVSSMINTAPVADNSTAKSRSRTRPPVTKKTISRPDITPAPPPRERPDGLARRARLLGRHFGTAASINDLKNPDLEKRLFSDFDQLVGLWDTFGDQMCQSMNQDMNDCVYDFSAADQMAQYASANDFVLTALIGPSSIVNRIEGSISYDDFVTFAKNFTNSVIAHFSSADQAPKTWIVEYHDYTDQGLPVPSFDNISATDNSNYLERVYSTTGIPIPTTPNTDLDDDRQDLKLTKATVELKKQHSQELLAKYLEGIYSAARIAAPKAKLYYAEDYDSLNSPEVFAEMKRLHDQKILDGVMITPYWKTVLSDFDATKTKSTLKMYAAAGIATQLFEIGVPVILGESQDLTKDDLQKQKKVYADMTHLCFSDMNCKAVSVASFTDRSEIIQFRQDMRAEKGRGYPAMFDENLLARPAYQALLDALKGPAI